MPIVGLNGLLLARSVPMLSTRDLKVRPPLPIRVQLYLGKFPGTKCKIGFFKPSLEFADLVNEPSKPPSWSEADFDGFSRSQANVQLGRDFTGDRCDRSSLQLRDRTGSICRVNPCPPGTPLSRTPRPQWSSGKTPRSWTTPSKSSSGFSHHPQIPPSRSPRTPAKPSNSSPPSTHDSSGQVGSSRALVSPRLGSPTRAGSYRYDSPGREYTFEPVSPSRSAPLISSPRSARSPRKERNRIREKAEKEATERARRIQRPLTQRSQQSLTKSEELNQGTKGLDCRARHQRVEVYLMCWRLIALRSAPPHASVLADSIRASKTGEWLKKFSTRSHGESSESSSHGFQYKDIPWINNLVYGKLKNNIKSVINSANMSSNVKVS